MRANWLQPATGKQWCLPEKSMRTCAVLSLLWGRLKAVYYRRYSCHDGKESVGSPDNGNCRKKNAGGTPEEEAPDEQPGKRNGSSKGEGLGKDKGPGTREPQGETGKKGGPERERRRPGRTGQPHVRANSRGQECGNVDLRAGEAASRL